MGKVNIQLTALAILLTSAAAWHIQGWRMQAQLDRATAAHAQQLEALHAQALADYLQMEDEKNVAIREAQLRAEEIEAAATAARADAERLRRDLARVPTRISTATRTAVDEYAATATAVFSDCTAQVTELARAADGHANDARLMLRAWPTTPTKAGQPHARPQN